MENCENQKDYNQENQRLYEQYVRETNDRIKSNLEAQDKMILTISSALFALIPFLLKGLQSNCCTIALVCLFLICNSCALISVLASFGLCAKGNEIDIKYAEEYYLQDKEESLNKKSCYTKGGELCNMLSLIFIALTLIILATILAVYFILKDQTMNQNDNTNKPNGEVVVSVEGNKSPIMTKKPNLTTIMEGVSSALMTKQPSKNNNNINSESSDIKSKGK